MKYVLIFLVLASSIASCKKGENDPFLSLKTRKGRLTGDWKVTYAEYSVNDTSYNFDGSNQEEKKGTEEAVSMPAEMKYSFDQNGKYSINSKITYPVDYFGPKTPEITKTYLEEGIWNFTGGAGDTKKKSQILLQPDRIENSIAGLSDIQIVAYEGPIGGKVYNLNMLKDKNMRWKYDQTENTPTGQNTMIGTFEFEKE